MAKRIEFIAPVEAMRGNLSGNQALEYPTNDNKAYDAPVGVRSYARNYSPRFIGAKRAKDGLKYFQVKTKSAIGLTAAQKHNLAVQGGAGAIIGAILADKTSTTYNKLVQAYESRKDDLGGISLRKYMNDRIRPALASKANGITFSVKGSTSAPLVVYNPWGTRTGSVSGVVVQVSNEVLVKFWGELATNGIYFDVEGMKGIAHMHDTFSQIVNGYYNVLGLSIAPQGDTYAGFIMLDEQYVCYMDDDTKLSPKDVEGVRDDVGYFLDNVPGESGG